MVVICSLLGWFELSTACSADERGVVHSTDEVIGSCFLLFLRIY